MLVIFHRSSARLEAIRRAPLPFSVLYRLDLPRSIAWLSAGYRLSLCSMSAAVLLASISVTHARQDHARSARSPEAADRIASIVESASRRFAVPTSWIRAVMQIESGGAVRAVSTKGAMGLMQIMPDTWTELRSRYGLGADPYDPHDNIIAGTAYLRELLDRFGERGFLAAYNAGPGRYQEHLATGKPLPSETLAYISAITSLPNTSSSDGASSATSWTSSSLFVSEATVGFTPHQPSSFGPQDRRSMNSTVTTATAHAPQSDGLFARKSDQRARP